jgi:hypothetical protein
MVVLTNIIGQTLAELDSSLLFLYIWVAFSFALCSLGPCVSLIFFYDECFLALLYLEALWIVFLYCFSISFISLAFFLWSKSYCPRI